MSPYRKSERPTLIPGDRVRVSFSLMQILIEWWCKSNHGSFWHNRTGTVIDLRSFHGCPCGSRGCIHNDGRDVPGAAVDLEGGLVVLAIENLERVS